MRFLPLPNKKDMSTKINQARTHQPTELKLQPGDLVRVRSRVEIESSLSPWGEFKGCAMMDEMWQYCETVQRIKKPVKQFVDERDYQIKKCNGIYLLEDLNCQGTNFFGSCDRSCFYFWREEWLEKICT